MVIVITMSMLLVNGAAHDKLRERTSWLIRYGLVIEGSQSRKTELAKDITS